VRAAIILDFFSNCLIEGNTITENAGDGIFTIIDSSPEVINSVIARNAAGLNISAGHPRLINNTVVDNGNGIYARDIANVTIVNSIFWNQFEIATEAFSRVDVTYSDVKGGPPGGGNISLPPLFFGGTDYRLADGSPCIDAGNGENAPVVDISGTMRPQGDGHDMGAYEFECLHYVDLRLSCDGRVPCHEFIHHAVEAVAEGAGGTIKAAGGPYDECLVLDSFQHLVLEALDLKYEAGSEVAVAGELQLMNGTAVFRKGCFAFGE
jgi:parallel beta-helix repeat protein